MRRIARRRDWAAADDVPAARAKVGIASTRPAAVFRRLGATLAAASLAAAGGVLTCSERVHSLHCRSVVSEGLVPTPRRVHV